MRKLLRETKMFTRLKSNKEQGFTILEMIVVIVIIGILASIAVPLFINQRKTAVDATVKSDIRNVATQLSMVAATKFPGGFALGEYQNNNGVKAVITDSNSVIDVYSNGKTFKIDLGVKASQGNVIQLEGDYNIKCVSGSNAGGDVAASSGGINYSLQSGYGSYYEASTPAERCLPQ